MALTLYNIGFNKDSKFSWSILSQLWKIWEKFTKIVGRQSPKFQLYGRTLINDHSRCLSRCKEQSKEKAECPF